MFLGSLVFAPKNIKHFFGQTYLFVDIDKVVYICLGRVFACFVEYERLDSFVLIVLQTILDQFVFENRIVMELIHLSHMLHRTCSAVRPLTDIGHFLVPVVGVRIAFHPHFCYFVCAFKISFVEKNLQHKTQFRLLRRDLFVRVFINM